MIKKLLVPFVVIAAFVAYILYSRTGTTPVAVTPEANTVSTFPVSVAPSTTAPAAPRYKDGTYTGSIADAYYGNVQVQAVINGGLITDVQFLQYPNDNGNSIEISRRSLPLLKAEAIQTQSANVDVISGATQTSQAFQQSFSAALSQAS